MKIATDPGLHLLFDLLAWGSAGLLAHLLYRWRLEAVAARTRGPRRASLCRALAVGAIGGAWAFGSWNTAMIAVPHPSHSVAGALAGGIIGVELYKLARGISGLDRRDLGRPAGARNRGRALGLPASPGCPTRPTAFRPTLPWGVDLGDGVPRHPVQVYESLAMLAFLAVYLAALARRAAWTRDRAFYLFVLVLRACSASPGSSSSPIRA